MQAVAETEAAKSSAHEAVSMETVEVLSTQAAVLLADQRAQAIEVAEAQFKALQNTRWSFESNVRWSWSSSSLRNIAQQRSVLLSVLQSAFGRLVASPGRKRRTLSQTVLLELQIQIWIGFMIFSTHLTVFDRQKYQGRMVKF